MNKNYEIGFIVDHYYQYNDQSKLKKELVNFSTKYYYYRDLTIIFSIKYNVSLTHTHLLKNSSLNVGHYKKN